MNIGNLGKMVQRDYWVNDGDSGHTEYYWIDDGLPDLYAYRGPYRFAGGFAQGQNWQGNWEDLYAVGPSPQLNSYGNALVFPLDETAQVWPMSGPGIPGAQWALGSEIAASGDNPLFYARIAGTVAEDDIVAKVMNVAIPLIIMAPVALAMAAGVGAEAAAATAGSAGTATAGSVAADMALGTQLETLVASGASVAGETSALVGFGAEAATTTALTGTALSDSIIAETGAGGIGNATAGVFGATAAPLTGTALSDSIIAETGAGGIGNATPGVFGATGVGAVEIAKTVASAVNTVKSIVGAAGAVAAAMGGGSAGGAGSAPIAVVTRTPSPLTPPPGSGTPGLTETLTAYWPVFAALGAALLLRG